MDLYLIALYAVLNELASPLVMKPMYCVKPSSGVSDLGRAWSLRLVLSPGILVVVKVKSIQRAVCKCSI